MADEEPSRRSGWEIPWDFIIEVTLLFILMGIGHLASRLLDKEWQLTHYLISGGLLLLGVGAIVLYRRSRQILP